jgi:hypothetical protein
VRLPLLFLVALPVLAQDPVATIEGSLLDASGGTVSTGRATVTNVDTGLVKAAAVESGRYRFAMLPVGRYKVAVAAPGFAPFESQPLAVEVSQVLRLDVRLEVAGVRESVSVSGEAAMVDTASNALGKTVTTREILDLPLNGRNFTQLGLLQAGVADLTNGIATAGGSLRAGQAYSVNGQRPESNNFLLDGAKNVNRMDGGFALRPPVDSISEFRILTHTAPPEYGGAAGSNTSVVTKSGTNQLHGGLYEFFRNDVFDARNFFSRDVEPLKQNQFGGTLGGPVQANKLFYFAYAEGFRNRQGITRSANVPTPAQRAGIFASGVIPPSQISAVGQRVAALYPLGNTTPSVYTGTVVTENESNQVGGRVDYLASERNQMHVRYSFADGYNRNPISIRGSDLPGFPVRDDLRTNSLALNETHVFSPNAVNAFRAAFFRHVFLFDQRLNQMSPRDFGFNYDSASPQGQSAPFFNVSGYSPVGGSITGPRTSAQTSWEVSDSLILTRGRHSWKLGAEVRRLYLNMFQAIAPNAFFVFAPTPPYGDGFANLLLGRPAVFYQGLGDLSRGMRGWETAVYAQDEWRVGRTVTLNYGLRWEVNTPLTELRGRMNAFVPGQQSTVRPEAPRGLLFPGDEGIAAGVAPVFRKGLMPRFGVAWNPDGRGLLSVRAGYGIFFDPLANGSGVASQVPVSSLPSTQLIQFSGPSVNFTNPYGGSNRPAPGTFPLPLTLVVMDKNARPPYAQNWNFTVQRSLLGNYVAEGRYLGSKGTRLPRNIEANPAVFGPGATAQNADSRRLYAPSFTHVAMLSYITNSSYHAGQFSLSRRFESGLGFNASYWFSKTIDYLSAMNLGGAAARPLAGENDIAQNPFDLRAERGLSLFDARHRFVFSGSWNVKWGWQLNGIWSAHSGTPFTVFDSTNVAAQASHPPISGYSGGRPDLIADPNQGPRTVEQWLPRSAFRRLNPVTDAGRFGNAGRNIARGPGLANLDLSLLKTFSLTERLQLQFRAEVFNVANHANFAVPVSDLNSTNFGRILEAGPSRLGQLALKLSF